MTGILSIYKRGQGVWTRGLTALGLLAMGTYGAVQTGTWLIGYQNLGGPTVLGKTIGVGLYLPVIVFLVFAALTVYLCNMPKPADLLIETEIEMRKVTWPTSKEVLGATTVVIVVVLIIGSYLFGLDKLFEYTFLRWLGVVPGG